MSFNLPPARRIGPPTIWNRLEGPLTSAAVSTPLLALAAAFVTWVETWGDRLSIGGYIQLWCLTFGILLVVTVVAVTLGPGRSRAWALGLVGSALLAVVWFWGLPILVTLGLIHVYSITPVNP
ncbi:hypothetical protein GCM10010203_17570 [Actinomadura yumaensis]